MNKRSPSSETDSLVTCKVALAIEVRCGVHWIHSVSTMHGFRLVGRPTNKSRAVEILTGEGALKIPID